MTAEQDVLILGGGCAGLTLAVELTQRGYDGRILIVEPRKTYTRDRTWCYWNAVPHSFQDCVTHRWNAWSVRAFGRETRCASHTHAYEQIPADRFYASALSRLRAVPTVALWPGTKAGLFRATASGFEVETTRGLVRARTLFDARPPERSAPPPMLTQQFLGWQIRSHDPVFDPGCVTLMDFWADQDSHPTFCYVLPYTEHEALVETTRLSPEPFHDIPRDERALRDYLAQRLGLRDYAIQYREQGAIPLGVPVGSQPKPPAGYHAIGTRGGLVRPSTGFAFLAIQHWSQAFAESFVAAPSAVVAPRPYSRLSGWLDGIFLRRLLDEPAATPETFLGLFDKVGADALVRFLSDRAHPRDFIEVIAALPTWPFMKLALTTALGRGADPRPCPAPEKRPASTTGTA